MLPTLGASSTTVAGASGVLGVKIGARKLSGWSVML